MIENKFINKKWNMPEFTGRECFIERIPDEIHQEMIDVFAKQYNFQNGDKMRIANYYVGISRSLSDSFVDFIREVSQNISKDDFPSLEVLDGFAPQMENLLPIEQEGGFSLGSFDMAVTEQGLQNIEFQAVATYPISAAKLNQLLLKSLFPNKTSAFANDIHTTWDDFIDLYRSLILDKQTSGIAIVDCNIEGQKTNFEFFATQKELNTTIAIVDTESIFEKDNELYYASSPSNQAPIKITRFYNRILLAEALFEEDYPKGMKPWKFRFDKKYNSLKFINHPIKQFEISKRLSPYIKHRFNPECHELAEVERHFRQGTLKYEDYIWKHKWGAAGHRLILSPTLKILDDLSGDIEYYIAQKKINFKTFVTDDGLEKIIELRFMTAQHKGKMIIVPMARIGHVEQNQDGVVTYKIHFGDNNKKGYGFSPVIIFD